MRAYVRAHINSSTKPEHFQKIMVLDYIFLLVTPAINEKSMPFTFAELRENTRVIKIGTPSESRFINNLS